MWTPATRRQHSRAGLRYETDLTDAEWAVIAPLMPEPAACGRPAMWTTREILNAIFYVLRGGIAWRLIPGLVANSGVGRRVARVAFDFPFCYPAKDRNRARGAVSVRTPSTPGQSRSPCAAT